MKASDALSQGLISDSSPTSPDIDLSACCSRRTAHSGRTPERGVTELTYPATPGKNQAHCTIHRSPGSCMDNILGYLLLHAAIRQQQAEDKSKYCALHGLQGSTCAASLSLPCQWLAGLFKLAGTCSTP